jgi:RsiW-degrading membrane proteinase PrsW (M82 family)
LDFIDTMERILIYNICYILPGLYFIYIYLKDKFEPEPLGKILKAVGWGAIPAFILSFLFESILPSWTLLITAPILEEACKGFYVYRMFKDPELEGPMDGLVYGAAVGMGFEIVENILYNLFQGVDLPVSVLRSITAGHILFTGLFGLTVGMAKMEGNRSWMNLGYFGAVCLHLIWNAAPNLVWYWIFVPTFIFILKKLLDVAWKYELDAYFPCLEEIEKKARKLISECGGASTQELADYLNIPPHRTILLMKNVGSKFDRKRKMWLFDRI